MVEEQKSSTDFQPNLFLPRQGLSTGKFSRARIVFLGSSGAGKGDRGARSQGEDKVTDGVKALGQHRAAEPDPPHH